MYYISGEGVGQGGCHEGEVLDQARRLGIEISTVALAIVYFEKLVLKGIVSKPNRKLVMSVCFVLAYKFNEPVENQGAPLSGLLEDIERVQNLTPKQVLAAEFRIYAHLLFNLHVHKKEYMEHFHQLLHTMDTNPSHYLGEDRAEYFFPPSSDSEAEQEDLEQDDEDDEADRHSVSAKDTPDSDTDGEASECGTARYD